MKKFFKFIWEVILYIWQLPQNLIGLFLRLFYPKAQKMEIADVKVLYDYSFPGGISLGRTIFVGTQDRFTSMHEHGHQIQSMYLGPSSCDRTSFYHLGWNLWHQDLSENPQWVLQIFLRAVGR